MSKGNDDKSEMRPEYDIRGGVRGKYLSRYGQAATITVTFASTELMTKNSASAPAIGAVTKPAVYPPLYPSPKIHVGTAV